MENKDSQNLEDNLPMVTYIMLHRIYDMLALIASKLTSEEDVDRMLKIHEDGQLFGPPPSYMAPGEKDE